MRLVGTCYNMLGQFADKQCNLPVDICLSPTESNVWDSVRHAGTGWDSFRQIANEHLPVDFCRLTIVCRKQKILFRTVRHTGTGWDSLKQFVEKQLPVDICRLTLVFNEATLS